LTQTKEKYQVLHEEL